MSGNEAKLLVAIHELTAIGRCDERMIEYVHKKKLKREHVLMRLGPVPVVALLAELSGTATAAEVEAALGTLVQRKLAVETETDRLAYGVYKRRDGKVVSIDSRLERFSMGPREGFVRWQTASLKGIEVASVNAHLRGTGRFCILAYALTAKGLRLAERLRRDMLKPNELRALEIIESHKNAGIMAQALARELRVDTSVVTGRIIPALKSFCVTNVSGRGYVRLADDA